MSSSFVAALVIQLVTMASGVLSARLLLPQGKGELTAVILWPSLLASVGSLGVIEAATYFTADQPNESPRVLTTTLALVMVLSLPLMAIGYALIPGLMTAYDTGVVSIARRYLVFIPISLVTLSLMGFLLGRLEFVQYNGLRVLGHAVTVVGIVVLYAVGHVSVYSFALASLASGVVTAGVAGTLVLRSGEFQWIPDIATLRRLVGYGLRSHLGTIASILNLRLDQMLMSVFLPPSILGLYVVAVTVSTAATLGANTVFLVAFPSIAHAKSEQAKRQALSRYVRFTLALSVGAAGPLFWLTPWILWFFFGNSFSPAVWMTRVLIVAAVPLAGNIICSAGLKAFNRPQIASCGEAVSLAVTAFGLALLLPRFRGMGAASASLLAYSAASMFLVWRFKRDLGISPIFLLMPRRTDWDDVVVHVAGVRNQLLGALKGWREGPAI